MNEERMIADAKRAARRLARTCPQTYQECLDLVANRAGRPNWGAFIADPVDVRTDQKAADDDGPRDGDGIVLGTEGGRTVRSSRQAVVLCIAPPDAAKTIDVLTPTLVSSPHASQIVHGVSPERLAGMLAPQKGSGRHLLAMHPLMMETPGMRGIYFNPLHPAFHDHDPARIGEHAQRIVAILMPSIDAANDHGFGHGARDLLTAVIASLLFGFITAKGRAGSGEATRVPSIPAVSDWIALLHGPDANRELALAAERCIRGADGMRFAQILTSAIGRSGADWRGTLATIERALLFCRNGDVRRFLEPQRSDDGAAVLTALGDAHHPTTVALVADLGLNRATSVIGALAIDLIGRWRARRGPSARSLQVIVGEASRHLHPTPWLGEVLADGAPSGTSVLLVVEGIETRHMMRVAGGRDIDALHADHVIVADGDRIALSRIPAAMTALRIPSPGSHIVMDREGGRVIETPLRSPLRSAT